MSKRETPEDAHQRRLELLGEIARYLEYEFPDCEIESPQVPDPITSTGFIRVLHERHVAYEVNFRRSFLDDSHKHIEKLKGWGLARRMKEDGANPIWVNTDGLS